MTLYELNAMAMRERATIYHTMRVSRGDSEMLAAEFYRRLTGILPSFRDFCIGLENGAEPQGFNFYEYHGMKIEWFCDGPTRFVLESFIYN